MRSILSTWCAFLLLLLMLQPSAHAGEYLALTGPLPPLSVNKGLRVKGIAVGTLIEIMDMAGVTFNPRNVKLVPWSVAYDEALHKPGRIMLNAPRTDNDNTDFKWVGPVVTSRFGLIGRKGEVFVLNTPVDALNYSVSTIRGSSPEKALLAQGVTKDQFKQNSSHVQALKQLKSGESDLFAYSDLGGAYFMKTMGIDPREYTMAHTYLEVPMYFAFNKATDDGIIAKLNKALRQLKQPGPAGVSRFDEIVERYLPNGRIK